MPNPTIPSWVQPLDTGQPNAGDLNDLGSLPKANFAAANQIIPITYGRDRLFGQPFVVHVDETLGHLYTAFSFCEGQIAGYEKIIIDGLDALDVGTAYVGLKNRGFETGDKTGWDEEIDQDGTVNATVAQTGTYGMNVLSANAVKQTQYSNRLLAPPEGTTICLKGSAQRNAIPTSLPTDGCRLVVWESTTVGGTLTAGVTVNTLQGDEAVAGWQELLSTYIVPAGVVEYVVGLRCPALGSGVGSWDFDDISTEILAADNVGLSADGIELVAYTGTQTQAADSLLQSSLTGYADALPGLAYIIARVPKDSTRGFPRLEAIVQGRLVYDPRLDSTAGDNGPVVTYTRSNAAWFRDWEGLYREVGANEARFDGARRVENLQIYSNDFGDASWVKTSSVMAEVPSVLSHDSKADVWELRDSGLTGAANSRVQTTTFSSTIDGKETYSCEFKQGSTSIPVVLFQLIGLTSSSNYIYLDLTTGIANGGGLGSSDQFEVTDLGDGWYRLSITVLGDATSKSVYAITYLAEAVSDVTFEQDGTHYMYMRNFQREDVRGQANHHAAEYVDTVATAAARTYNTDRLGSVLVGSRTVTNKALWSTDFSNAAWVKISGATIEAGFTDPDNGSNAYRLTSGGADSGIRQQNLHPADVAVINSLWIRRVTGTGTIEVYTGNATNRTDISSQVTSAWQRITLPVVATTTGTDSFGVVMDDSGDQIDIAFYQTEVINPDYGLLAPGEYQETTTVEVTSSLYSVDLNGEPLPGGRGLMMEDTRANIINESNEFDGGLWTHDSGTPTMVDTTSIFPDYQATRFTNDSSANSRGRQTSGSFTDTEGEVLSAIIENVDALETRMIIRDETAAATLVSTVFTWATSVAALGGTGAVWVDELGIGPNGGRMIRLSIMGLGTAAGTGATGNTIGQHVYPVGALATTREAIVHHVQHEQDSTFPTSPIVCPSSGNVTRSLDNANGAVETDMVSATNAGTLFAKGTRYRGIAFGTYLVSLNAASANNRIAVLTGAGHDGRFYTASGGGVQSDYSSAADEFNTGRPVYMAIGFDQDDNAGYVNGVQAGTDGLADLPVGVMSDLDIGQSNTATQQFNGYMSEARYYNFRQPNEWLEEATKGNVYDQAPHFGESLTMAFNFARDMSLSAAGNAGGVGAHRVDDVTTWEFSQNPTLCFRDTVENFTGWGILDEGVVDNANANDEVLDGVPRRQVGLTLAKANTIDSWMKGWRAYMGAFLNWESGKIRVIPNRPDVEAPGAIVLDGTTSTYVRTDSAVGSDFDIPAAGGQMTIEAWVKGPDITAAFPRVVDMEAASNYVRCQFNIAGEFRLAIHDGTSGLGLNTLTSGLDVDEWNHVAYRIDRVADEMSIVLNGVLDTSLYDISSMTADITLAASDLVLGADVSTSNRLTGTIDEVRVWDTLLSVEDIAASRFSEISQPETEPNLIGYWKLNENSSASVAVDSSRNGNDGTLTGGAVFGFGHQQVIPDGVAMHIGVDDLVKDSLKLRRRSLRAVPNSVAIDYEDSSGTRWFTARTQADSVRVTGNQEARRLSRVSLPGIHNASQAAREATERLNWYLTDLECTLTLFDEGWNLTHGSIVAVTHPIGLDAKLFRVRQSTARSGRWTVDLTEYDPAIYSDEIIADPTIPDTNLGDPLNPPTVSNLVLAEELFNYKTGTTGSRVRITWNATTFPFLSQYLVEGWVGGAKVWQTTTAANDIVTPGVEEIVDTIGTETDYEVRVYVQSPFASGAAAIDTVTIQGKFAIPGDPTGAVATQTFADGVDLTWVAAVDIDIWRYEVRRGTTSDTWATAVSLEFLEGLSYTDTGLALGTHRYFIKAIDSVKQESTNAAQADVTLSAPVAVAGLFGFEVASEVRLNWAAVTSGFVERYRIAYSDVPETFETTLDVVDTIRFSTKDVPEGTFTFKAYSVDKVGNEAATAAEAVIEVTSDADAFLADTYSFSFRTDAEPDIVANGSLTNFVKWNIRTDALDYYVTNMADSFAVSPTDFVAADPLANYHSTGASEWLSETKDFGLLLTGSWNLTHDTVALLGNVDIALELSTDDVTYVSFGGSSKGEFRYARVRISTVASPGTATAFVKNPVMQLKINVVPLEESGESVSSPSAGTGDTINLSREYTALKEITTQPKNTIASGSAVTSIVDNIVIGPNTAIQCNGTEYYSGGDWAELDPGTTDFSVEYITKHDGSAVSDQIMFGKRNGSATGWSVYHHYDSNEIEMRLDDSSAVFHASESTGDAFPNDGEMHHVCITVARGGTDEVRIYVDGVLTGGSPFDISTASGNYDNAVNFNIFATNSGSSIHAAGGVIDQLRIWSDVRTPAEILANYNKALDMTQTQTGLVHYQLCDGDIGGNTGDITDVTVNARTLTATGAGDNTYVDPGNTGPNVQKINSFDVFIFDTFGQQLAEQYQWKWKAV